MDCIIHEVAKSWSQLSNFHFRLLLSQHCLNARDIKGGPIPCSQRVYNLEKKTGLWSNQSELICPLEEMFKYWSSK